MDLGIYNKLYIITTDADFAPTLTVLLFVFTAIILVAKQIELYHDKVHLMSFKMHIINTL